MQRCMRFARRKVQTKTRARCAGRQLRGRVYFLMVDDLLVLASATFIGAPSTDLPFTCKPACDNLAAVFSRMPLTRFSRSAQSLKSPPLVRSSIMALDLAGPMPLTLSSADTSALLISTWASANVIVATRVAMASSSFLIIAVSVKVAQGGIALASTLTATEDAG